MRPKINKQRKDANNEADHEESMVLDDTIVVKEPIYFNIFKCGKNQLNRIAVTYEQACMETPRYKYYMELYRTRTDCNDRNGAPFSSEKIRDSIHRVNAE